MKSAIEIYPDYWEEEQERGSFYGPYDYQPIIDEIGNILIQVDDKDYQGDSRILFEKNGMYGFLIFGWGSCSGCDALQGCRNISQVQELIDQLVHGVMWFGSLEQLQEYFKNKDWSFDWAWHQEQTREFIQRVLEYKK